MIDLNTETSAIVMWNFYFSSIPKPLVSFAGKALKMRSGANYKVAKM